MKDESYKNQNEAREPKSLLLNIKKFTLLLGLNPETDIPNSITAKAEELGLIRKDEEHITVLSNAVAKKLRDFFAPLSELERLAASDAFSAMVNKLAWNYNPQKEYYLVSKKFPGASGRPQEERKAIIELVDLPDLEPFYVELTQKFGLELELPIPHVTLFTGGDLEEGKKAGIGIYSVKEFESMDPQKIE